MKPLSKQNMSSRGFVIIIPALAIFSLFTSEGVTRVFRRLAVDCIQNVFASSTKILTIPEIPTPNVSHVPAYLALCQEWIRQDAYHPTGDYESFQIVEDIDVCLDWSAPHLALMEIYAASIVSNQLPRIKYRHNCDRTVVRNEAAHGFDYTTVQQVLNTPGLRSNLDVLSVDALKQQCRRCLLSYDPQLEEARVAAKGYHHCFAFPEDTSRLRNWDPAKVPYVPYSYPGVAPFSTIIVAFRQRLYHSALEWQDVVDAPPKERTSGVVYWLDPTTIGLAYADVLSEIPNINNVTSISILAGPLCATAYLPTGQVCHQYGEALRDYLATKLPRLLGKGYKGEHGVTFKMMTSTAAANSRMIISKTLICPPRSPSCLFPAVAKRVNINTAIVLEDPGWMKAVDFMSIAGHHGTTKTKILPPYKIPRTYTEPPSVVHRTLVTVEHTRINAVTDSEGYPQGVVKRAIPDDATIASLSPQQILDDFAIAMERFNRNPNKFMTRLEIIPSAADIQRALANRIVLTANQVIKWNYPKYGTGGPGYRHGELCTDADSRRNGVFPTVEYYTTAADRRHDSMLRMKTEWATAFYGHIQNNRNLDDPSTIFEIKCPSGIQPDGSLVHFATTGDVVTRTTANTIIVASQYGITIRDATTGVTVATGIQNVPYGTVYREKDGYKIKNDNSPHILVRRTVEIDPERETLAFRSEVQKMCEKYQIRLDEAVMAQAQQSQQAQPQSE